jgi:shikimate dehydrogenase
MPDAGPGPGRRCAVLGSPIRHSLSPVLHRAAYTALGLDWVYERHEVTEAELESFVSRLDESWRGLSLTMPLKVAALRLGQVHPLAALVGAANTVVFDPDTPRVYNTDVGGLVAAVRDAGGDTPTRVTVVGAGATARSAMASAAELGAQVVTVVARNPAKVEGLRPLAEALGLEMEIRAWDAPTPPSDLLVSTVTAGAADDRATEFARSAAIVFDAIYDPWPTPLASAAHGLGRTVVNGLDLLVRQAVLQVELMTGRRVEPQVLQSAGRAALSRAALSRPGPA